MAFNEGYITKKAMSEYATSGFMDIYKEDLAIPGYIDKALDLCLEYGVVDKLGLSFFDLMNMDIWVFQRIKKMLEVRRPKEDQIIQQLQKQSLK